MRAIDFENETGFSALAYEIEDPHGEVFHVIVARGTYDLRAAPAPESTLVVVPAAEHAELVFSDEYYGEINRSSVKYESDLAQQKPRCDVIVIGSAHSPSGAPEPRVEVGIRIDRPIAVAGIDEVGTLLEQRLVVHGPRSFVRERSAEDGWRLTEPEPFTSLPIRYEHAFGGELRIAAGDEAEGRLDDAHRLGDEARAKHPDGASAPVAHTACLFNPVGTGWLEAWYADARAVDCWPAPRIEAPGAELTASLFGRLVCGDALAGERPELTPRGFGIITKPWQPRLKLAGTFDERWLAERWPRMPADFEMAYWNGAHPAMQCAHLFGGEQIELWNLAPPGAPGATVERGGRVVLRSVIPLVRVAARLRTESGNMGWGGLSIDTLIIDVERMQISLVWRLVAPAKLKITHATLMAAETPNNAA